MPGFIPDVQGLNMVCTAGVGITTAEGDSSLWLPVCKTPNEMSERGRAGGATRASGVTGSTVLFGVVRSIYHGT